MEGDHTGSGAQDRQRRQADDLLWAGAAPSVPVFDGGSGPHPGVDLTSNSALYEALDDGLDPDRRR